MILHSDISTMALMQQIKQKKLCFGGNRKLNIYGTLQCVSGKRMKRENRVFFYSEVEAINQGYRPCGHCMRGKYKQWICSAK